MNIICSFESQHSRKRSHYSKKFVSEKTCKDKMVSIIERCPQIKDDDIYVSEINSIPNDILICGEGYNYKERELYISFKEPIVNDISLAWFRKLPYLSIVIKPFTVIHSLSIYNCDIGQLTILPDYDYNSYYSPSVEGNYINTYNSFIGKIVVSKRTGKTLISDKRTINRKLNFLERKILVK